MDNLDVICIGAAIVDIPLQPVSKNIFDVDSYPLERIAMTTGGDAINEATIISRLGHRTALMSRIGKDAAGQFILDHCRKENMEKMAARYRHAAELHWSATLAEIERVKRLYQTKIKKSKKEVG